jgi:RNA polymerase sigma factor (sigma-70 family)
MDATDGIELAVLRAERGSKTGSAETLEEIFRAEYPRLVGIVVRVTGDRARAEEVASEAFCKLANRPALFRPKQNIGGWLYRTATNLGLNSLKAELRRRRHESEAAREAAHAKVPTASALEEILTSERQLRVRKTLAAMNQRSAQLLLLQHGGLSYRELASALEIHPASVGQYLLRAAAEFKKEFTKQSEGKK